MERFTSDFRDQAAVATTQRMSAGAQPLAELADSGCVPVPHGRRTLYLVELSHLALLVGSMVLLLLVAFLASGGSLPRLTVWLALALALGVSLCSHPVKALVLRAVLFSRPDALRRPGLPRRAVGLEDARTYQKVKLVAEDRTLCTFDAARRQLLLEGCAYRYSLRAHDVLSVQPVPGHSSRVVRLVCRLAGHPLAVVLIADGFGPWATLVQMLVPSTRLARLINRTLFGLDTGAYERHEPPALLTCTECGRDFPPTEVIHHRDRVVCAGCKPAFLQRLREGVER